MLDSIDLSGNAMMWSDEEIIEAARSDKVTEAMAVELNAIIISRYMRIVYIKARKMRSPRLDEDDLVSEGLMGLLSALRSFSRAKGEFKAFANTCINNRMKTALTSAANTLAKAEDFDFNLLQDEIPETVELIIEKEKESEIMRELSGILSKREYDVVSLYLNAYSYKQIANRLGTSIKAVDNALSRARAKLKDNYRGK